MGYHTRDIKRGVYGDFSKVVEEWEELLDARLQDGKILELVEIADLYGALEGYLEKRYGMNMEDVAKMSRMTSSAFIEGKRVAPTPESVEPKRCSSCQIPEEDGDETFFSVRDDGKLWCHFCWFDRKR